jgi:N-hydroxyarylamine O-acetyltransferase
MTVQTILIEPILLEQVLSRLGFSSAPDISLSGLESVYEAWCNQVPFDNLMKLIHVQSKNPAPLPGDNATQFFESWLKHRTGGTCWAGNGALFSLLSALGFNAERGVCTMMVAPNLPPNHATVIAHLDQKKYMLDASITHCKPIQLDPQIKEHSYLPKWVKNVSLEDNHWYIDWVPVHRPQGLDCRIDYEGASREDYSERHEQTREWSPFNYELHVRQVRNNAVKGLANGKLGSISLTGAYAENTFEEKDRARVLIEEFGYSEEVVNKLPPDTPTPPPPGSKTAMS